MAGEHEEGRTPRADDPAGDSRPSPLEIPELSRSIELVQLVQQGDQHALDELFERYKPRLLRIIRVKLGPRLQRHLDEDDILQEVFLIALRKMREFELRSHAGILQWLARIAENQISNRLEYYEAEKRDAGREQPLARDTGTTRGIHLAASELSPSQKAVRSEFEELIDAQVQGLDPPEYRDVILHRDYYQEEWDEVRSNLGRPSVEAVQELYRRAHRRLRERMQKHLGRE